VVWHDRLEADLATSNRAHLLFVLTAGHKANIC
jgi:hypothetical protein